MTEYGMTRVCVMAVILAFLMGTGKDGRIW
jgi:hypothetical protein